MLLNKYEDFSVIAKDEYAEELLFKIEKNFNNFKTLQDKAFPHLQSLTGFDPRTEFTTVEEGYRKLAAFAAKFDQLAVN